MTVEQFAIQQIKSLISGYDKIELEIFEGQHEVSLARVFEFLEKSL